MVSIQVSDAALRYLQQKIAQEKGIGLRISIKKTGCSGFSYQPQVIQDSAVNAQDEFIQIGPGLTIYVDAKWIALLDNLSIDYQEENIAGLKQKRLVIASPHETSRCGCGESFHVEK